MPRGTAIGAMGLTCESFVFRRGRPRDDRHGWGSQSVGPWCPPVSAATNGSGGSVRRFDGTGRPCHRDGMSSWASWPMPPGDIFTTSNRYWRRRSPWAASRLIEGRAMQRLAIRTIRWYQAFSRRYLPASCRYWPSCSQYAIEAIQAHGVLRGVWLAGGRLLRCQPLSAGGVDQVPERI